MGGVDRGWIGQTCGDKGAGTKERIFREANGEGVRAFRGREDEDAGAGAGDVRGQPGDGRCVREEAGEFGPDEACGAGKVVEEAIRLQDVVRGQRANVVLAQRAGLERVVGAVDVWGGAAEAGNDEDEFTVNAGESLDAIAEVRNEGGAWRRGPLAWRGSECLIVEEEGDVASECGADGCQVRDGEPEPVDAIKGDQGGGGV